MLGVILNNTYRLEQELSAGGMGQIYIGSHVRIPGRLYAIKQLRPELAAAPSFRERFQAEAEAMMALEHPNIVRIEDFLVQESCYYLVMEFVRGEPLENRMRNQGAMPPDRVHTLMMELLSGLEICHEKDIIHRDLKPANILLDEEGTLKLTDFGIALRDQGDNRLTKPGTVLGTPDYMSPEQIMGKALDVRSDIYSAGVIMYEMLTGRTPFLRSSDSEGAYVVFFAHVHQEPTPIEDPNIPQYLKIATMRCLEKDSNRRFQTVGEMALFLEDKGMQTTPEFLLPDGLNSAVMNASGIQRAAAAEREALNIASSSESMPSGDLVPAAQGTRQFQREDETTPVAAARPDRALLPQKADGLSEGADEAAPPRSSRILIWLFTLCFVGGVFAAGWALELIPVEDGLSHVRAWFEPQKRDQTETALTDAGTSKIPSRPSVLGRSDAGQPSPQRKHTPDTDTVPTPIPEKSATPPDVAPDTGSVPEAATPPPVRRGPLRLPPPRKGDEIGWPDVITDLCRKLLESCFWTCVERRQAQKQKSPFSICKHNCWKIRSKKPFSQFCQKPPEQRRVY